MKAICVRIFVFCLLSISVATLCAKELDSKIEKTAQKLSATAATQNLSTSTLAIFPFQADDKLSKKKVNVAVSELMTNSFLKLGTFKLTERTRLEEVMKEQKLGLSGAVDSQTAADIGKLMGAKLMVLGNVIQVGNFYQITTKLVNSETSEIITSEVFEVPVKTFDEDAERYLVLVPERQTLAIQVLVPIGMAAIAKGPAKAMTPAFGGSFTASPRSGTSIVSPTGFGLRYFPASWLVLEGAYFLTQKVKAGVDFSQNGSNVGLREMDIDLGIMRVGAAYTGKLGKHIRFYTGLMMVFASVDATSASAQDNISLAGGSVHTQESNKTSYPPIPMARVGAEWKPQERFGLGLFGNISSGAKEITRDLQITNDVGGKPALLGDLDVVKIKFPTVSVEGSFSFYF